MAACTPSLCQDANTWWKWLLAASCSVPITHLSESEQDIVFFWPGTLQCAHIVAMNDSMDICRSPSASCLGWWWKLWWSWWRGRRGRRCFCLLSQRTWVFSCRYPPIQARIHWRSPSPAECVIRIPSKHCGLQNHRSWDEVEEAQLWGSS